MVRTAASDNACFLAKLFSSSYGYGSVDSKCSAERQYGAIAAAEFHNVA